jgi:hypothetical protein
MTTSPTLPAHDVTTQPAIWLRDSCACAECRDPRNGQKLFGITDLPVDLAVTHVDGTTVTFSDGHVSRFYPGFLSAEQPPDHRSGRPSRLPSTTGRCSGPIPSTGPTASTRSCASASRSCAAYP